MGSVVGTSVIEYVWKADGCKILEGWQNGLGAVVWSGGVTRGLRASERWGVISASGVHVIRVSVDQCRRLFILHEVESPYQHCS